MKRAAPLLCLLALLGGCNKKRKAAPQADSPPGQLAITLPADNTNPPVPQIAAMPKLPPGWVEFRQPDGAYTVFLPAVPKREQGSSSLGRPIPAGGFLLSTYEGYAPGLSFWVSANVCSPELVDSMRAADEQEMTGPDKKRTKVTWAGHPADEILVEDPKGVRTVYVRHMLIGNWAYLCRLQGDRVGRPTAEERATIFDSFRPTPKK